MQEFKSLYELFEAIPAEQAAIDHFRAIRWKHGEFCPYCGHKTVYHFSDNRTHKCGKCRKRFSIKVGTIFEDSKIEMRKWLAAIWLITSHRKGIASTQLARDLKVTQKTAWFMLHRLRHAARTRPFNRPLSGEVEVDEAFMGGKDRNRHAHRRGKDDKAVVLGMLERGGELRAKPITDIKTAKSEVFANVEKGSAVMTDEWPGYKGLNKRSYHYTVAHAKGEYSTGYAHVNAVEGVWSILKRQVYGIHHWVSKKHLRRYVDEVVFRYNRRFVKEGSRVSELLYSR